MKEMTLQMMKIAEQALSNKITDIAADLARAEWAGPRIGDPERRREMDKLMLHRDRIRFHIQKREKEKEEQAKQEP